MANNIHQIGDVIAKLRKEKGWTQHELADKLNISDKAISKWESNKGDPSIEFLPKLAELFSVTIDYLMTGKEQEAKIVTISKLELCAKNDDVELFKELYCQQMKNRILEFKDENNMNIFDYIFKYESINLFNYLFKEVNIESYLKGHRSSDFFENIYYMRLLCNDTTIIKDLIRLEHKNSTVNNFRLFPYDKGLALYNGDASISIPRKILSDRIIDLIVNGNLDKSIYDAVTSNHSEKDFYSPAFIFSHIIEFTLKQKDWTKGQELLNKAITINKENFDEGKDNLEKRYSPGYDHSYYERIYIGFVQIPNSTFDVLFDEEKYELIELANQVNKVANDYYNLRFHPADSYEYYNYIASNYDIEKNKINKQKNISDVEKQKLLCIHDGMVNLDELVAINNFEFYEKMLKKYPICEYEILFNQLYNKEYDKIESYINFLPKYSVVCNDSKNKLLHALRLKKHDELETHLEECLGKVFENTCNSRYVERYIPKKNLNSHYNKKDSNVTYDKLILAKNFLFLNEVIDKDLKFIEKACKTATKSELDNALMQIEPDNFEGINILLNHGAMLKKSWIEEDGDGDKYTITEDDKIGTEILKKKIKDILKQ